MGCSSASRRSLSLGEREKNATSLPEMMADANSSKTAISRATHAVIPGVMNDMSNILDSMYYICLPTALLGQSLLRSSFCKAFVLSLRCTCPCSARDISPVSSLTITTLASQSSVNPMAERCRRPSSLGIFILCDTGKMQAAERIRPPLTMTAPSCSGVFL